MALPIWGIWMKKCLADPTIGWSELDTFPVPPSGALAFDCESEGQLLGGYSGEAIADSKQGEGAETEEDYYFN